jgi:hypothetical protein
MIIIKEFRFSVGRICQNDERFKWKRVSKFKDYHLVRFMEHSIYF